MPGRRWLGIEVIALLLVAHGGFSRQLQCSRAWNASDATVSLCLPCMVPEGIDTCMYDISGCGFLASGSVCEVHCKAPYQGNSTIARCAANNLQPGLPLEWTPPSCSFSDCPFPIELPAGYMRDSQGNVHCAAGYIGRPVRRCKTDPLDDCAIRPADLVGCELVVGCNFQEEQECEHLEYQKCRELGPGEVCRAPCAAPFEGPGQELRCPADNTEPGRAPWAGEVQCELPCPPPDPLPYGYVNNSDVWECAPGYAGTAKLICVFDAAPFCQRRVELQGCYPLMPCADLELTQELAPDPCVYNLTECRGVLPGERCQLRCLPPFIDGGLPRFARCPALNVNPFQELIFGELPRCLMTCPDPPTLPEGYRRDDIPGSSQSQWRCDDGWVGEVNRTCLHFSNCSFQVLFDGCRQKKPCLPPALSDSQSCKMDAQPCEVVEPGSNCEVTCRPPYDGASTIATCLADNVDPARDLEFTAPICQADCDPYPPGYMLTAAGWGCAPGYNGVVRAERADCGEVLQLSGCLPLRPCRSVEEHPCILDASDCVDVFAGSSCVVRCPAGVYEPDSVIATCPEGNTDPLQPLIYDLSCTPKCVDPDPVPPEFEKDPDESWACADGFIGNASEVCEVSYPTDWVPNCTAVLNLTGCASLEPCGSLLVEDTEMFDASRCQGLGPGQSCEIPCRPPFHGEARTAFCPEDNTDRDRPPTVTGEPSCRLACDAAPVGYEKLRSGWRCAPGYAGNVSVGCQPSYRCGAELHLTGCKPIVPCRRPRFGPQEVCRYEASDCPESMAAGSSCQIRCHLPYEGSVGLATCSPENTDPEGEAMWTKPLCSFSECPDPAVYSSNYTKDPGSPVGWRCSDGMNGIAAKRCESAPSVPPGSDDWPDCEVQEGFLSGCGIPQPCLPLEAMDVWDGCVYDNSHCGEMVPNSFCEVRCRQPYVGAATFSRCPTFNIIPNFLVDWEPPSCVLDCPMPDPVPEGYELVRAGQPGVEILDEWRCAPGYTGQAVSRCVFSNETECGVGQQLHGCLKLEPCVVPSLAHCSLNFSECLELGPGESCKVTCKASYTGFIRPAMDEEDFEEANASNASVNDSNGSFAINISNETHGGVSEPALLPADGVMGLCPIGNTVAGREFDLPELVCVFADCIDPDPIPEPYKKVEDVNSTEDIWQCAEGFAGNATATCVFREDCVGEYALSECLPVAPCAAPAVDPCRFQAADCDMEPGSSCPITCREPTQGAPGMATCPPMNIQLGAPPEIYLPHCETPCMYLEDVQAPTGYTSCENAGTCPGGENATGWTCAAGYGGNATTTCFVDSENNCSASHVFSGCLPLTICAGMENPDQCRYIHSCIPGLLPGEQCEFRCKPPSFLGDPTTGTCPIDNTDPLRPPVVPVLPSCEPQCTEPSVPPQGYNRSGAQWTCANGYLGDAVPNCAPDRNCVMRFTLTGCVEKVPCSAPPVAGSCQYVTNCPDQLLPGEGCQVDCQTPFYGSSTNASCDENNTVLNIAPDYTLPNCSLQCLDPPVNLTEAYVETPNGWECNETGYLGTVVSTCSADSSCNAILVLSGCLPVVPCLTPDPRAFDQCQFNFTGCDALTPGTSCNVSCQAPYIGSSTIASCVEKNVNPLEPLQFDRPSCTLLCPEPDPAPAGYVRGPERWTCAPGYTGTASASCYMDRFFSGGEAICITRTELTGCMQLQPCWFPSSDVCDYDTSNCSLVPAGGMCQVFCRVPMGGGPAIGRCPATNIDPNTYVDVQMPNCILDCPIPEELPPEYNVSYTAVREDGLAVSIFSTDPLSGRRARIEREGYFICAELHAGNLTVSCSIDLNCQWRIEFAGCKPTVACQALDLATPPCGLIGPGCDTVVAGKSCQASCAAPCTGQPAVLSCPLGNTDAEQKLMGRMPQCVTECDFVPPGYRRHRASWDGWECAEGYIGTANVLCVPSGPGRVCDTEILLWGCDEMLSCGAGMYDPCKYDLSDCMNVPRSESCTIRCRYPYTGPDFNATCPSENIMEDDGLVWEEDRCVLADCPDPNMTDGSPYVWDGSAFVCRDGFVGSPSRRCTARGAPPDCSAEATFDGCLPQQPCAAPDAEFCRFELDDCRGLGPGEICALPCKFPYVGTANSSASCPANNTDFLLPPLLDTEDDGCELTCDDPVIPPPGYEKVGNTWQCTTGYAGSAHVHCVLNETDVVNETCGSYMMLSGCLQLQPCQPPTYIDKCMYEAVNCEDLPPGSSCAITCRYPPYSPDVYQDGLVCPQDNVDPLKEVEVRQIPTCELFCPSPPPPPGYVKLHDLLLVDENGTEINRDPAYTCASGWTGTPNHTCSINSSTCAVPVTLQGCFQMLPCQPIDPRIFDVCTYNITDCVEKSQTTIAEYTGPAPGTLCQLSCRDPMRGDFTNASCVERNIDPRRRMEYELPSCSMYCPQPAMIPEGYVYVGAAGNLSNSSQLPPGANVASLEYHCAPGFAGVALIACHLEGAYSSATGTVECVTVTSFSGCSPSQPCVAPQVDSCRHDVSGCRDLPPGQTCEVSCTPPLVGAPSTFHCPADNVDSTQLVLGSLPACRFPFGCEEPVPLTEGYVKVNESYYECADGFIGEAEWDCYLARFCAPLLILSGCDKLVPCVAPAVEDQICGLNYSACDGTGPGQMCRVPCMPGYIENASYVWEDDVDMESIVDANESVDGSHSNITAGSSYTCPVGNIDPTKVIALERIRCEFQACIDPSPPPLGYTKLRNGTWTCQSGFVGEVVRECQVCNASFSFSGCLPLVPCLAPALSDDQCMLDLSNCTLLDPGHVCKISCQQPFWGSVPSYGLCPADNTDPTLEFNFTMPDCQLTCGPPDPVPLSYAWSESSGWQCAEGFSGEAEFHCELTSGCESSGVLSGCYAPLPCDVPVVDRCAHVDIGCNSSIAPGQECNFTCAPPFVGETEVAHCPQDNQNISGGLVWSLPRCVMPYCEDPIGEGYQRTTSGWQCAPGYAGMVRSSCEPTLDCCEVHLALEGCRTIAGCALPTEYNECELDFSDCTNISSGGSCEVSCRAPYVGLPTVAQCPPENTEPERMVEWTSPQCQVVSCPPPEPLPRGFDYDNETKTYSCAEGYLGRPSITCRGGMAPRCAEVVAELSGCLPLAPCLLPSLDMGCMLETTCENGLVEPGGFCKVSCRAPYIGVPENATCPSGNTDSGTMAALDLPTCVLHCDPPAVIPPGYERTETGWRCVEGFTGGAFARCVLDQETCRASLLLDGCLRLEPCKPPPNPDPCQYDLFGCDRVHPGTFCRLRCRPPFTGGSPKLICPAGNTNPDYVMKWAEPYCYCPAPDAVPAGYAEDGQGGFLCAPGYVGQPSLFCAASPQCWPAPALAGCVSPDVCHVEPFIDEDDRPGFVSGIVAFGPAEVEGVIEEGQVDGYDILFADDCGQALPGPPLASVPRRPLFASGGCCEVRSYQVAIQADLSDVEIPNGAAMVLVAISGLSHGKVINFTDRAEAGVSTSNKVSVTGAAHSMQGPWLLPPLLWLRMLAFL